MIMTKHMRWTKEEIDRMAPNEFLYIVSRVKKEAVDHRVLFLTDGEGGLTAWWRESLIDA